LALTSTGEHVPIVERRAGVRESEGAFIP
jgi:hypothetical protein